MQPQTCSVPLIPFHVDSVWLNCTLGEQPLYIISMCFCKIQPATSVGRQPASSLCPRGRMTGAFAATLPSPLLAIVGSGASLQLEPRPSRTTLVPLVYVALIITHRPPPPLLKHPSKKGEFSAQTWPSIVFFPQ